MIGFTLERHQQLLVERCEGLANEIRPWSFAADRDGAAPMPALAAFRREELFGLLVPEAFGGLGYKAIDAMLALSKLAEGDAAATLGFNMHMFAVWMINNLPGISDAKRAEFNRLAVESLLAALVSEDSASSMHPGSFVPSLRARRVKGGYVLNGMKHFASNFEACDHAMVFAHREDNPNPLSAIVMVMPRNTSGITVHQSFDLEGMRSTRSNSVEFKDVFVSDDQVLTEMEDFLAVVMAYGGVATFGLYSSVYLGGGFRLCQIADEKLTTTTPKGAGLPKAYWPSTAVVGGNAMSGMWAAESLLWRAATMVDTDGPAEAFPMMLAAKVAIGRAVGYAIRELMDELGANAYQRTVKGKPSELNLVWRNLLTVKAQPPAETSASNLLAMLLWRLELEKGLKL